MNTTNSESDWISISDIMTGLMVIFLFITVSYMVEANQRENEIKLMLDEFENTKDSIAIELAKIIDNDLSQWEEYVEFDRENLSIKFVGKDIQFKGNSARIRSKFLEILDDFIPRYMEVVSKPKYADKIAEIRIEGHANKAINNYDGKNYMYGVDWSQKRAKAVLNYFIKHESYRALPDAGKGRLEFWMVANGYGFGRTLDADGSFTRQTGQGVCEDCSRRVEFRIITKSEQVIADLVTKLKKG